MDVDYLRKLVPLVALLVLCSRASHAQDGGLYTTDQAEHGRAVYRASCARCHGVLLNDGPANALAGPAFLARWRAPGRALADLYDLIRTTMPRDRAGSLPQQSYLDVVAYLLARNGFQSGAAPLAADTQRLHATRLADAPLGAPVVAAASPFITGEHGLNPSTGEPSSQALARADTNASDWLYHTHDYTGRRYARLDQITPANARQLRAVCALQLGEMANFQTGPVVYRGVMYLTTPHVTTAMDAATCRMLWRYTWEPQAQEPWLNNRGVAVASGRVIRGTNDGYLLALDARTGDLLWARQIGDASRGETFTMAPLVLDSLIIIGPAVSENAIQGWIGAFRISDGSPVWRFNTFPRQGERGYDTWNHEAGVPLGGGAVWSPLSLDVARGELYLGAGNPAPDFAATLRGGANLYTNALVALDVRTGALRWYDQLVPSDGHDWDLTQVSPIFRAVAKGKERDLIATTGKDGLLHVLDRVSHERIYEVAVTTRSDAALPVTTAGVHACPGILGGVEWNGPAYDPSGNLLFVPAVDWCATYTLADTIRLVAGQNYLGGKIALDSVSQGWVTAIDGSTGQIKWRYRSPGPVVAAVTPTAGGVVFAGELTGDFLALDASTGAELFRFNTGGPIGGGVVSYAVKGKQYVAVMSGRPSIFWIGKNPGSATAFVFALP
ncbi:MAG TPA: PQQ-binding-like beta-propeller repeat protein [Gemmatimonadaceae bacterium]|nr:PQQ-binding-like beta-propeller repeat protein [Gemmatimonadaceae bacterium]